MVHTEITDSKTKGLKTIFSPFEAKALSLSIIHWSMEDLQPPNTD